MRLPQRPLKRLSGTKTGSWLGDEKRSWNSIAHPRLQANHKNGRTNPMRETAERTQSEVGERKWLIIGKTNPTPKVKVRFDGSTPFGHRPMTPKNRKTGCLV
jgi:hypothetical protein